jgi:hypothetical protein
VTFDAKLSIEGLQEAQKANLKAINALKPSGALGRAVQFMSSAAHRAAVFNTPWDTGSLRASHRIKLKGDRGIIYIDPGASNPRSRTPPHEYGQYLHDQGMIPGIRGGIRAFYAYTEQTQGDAILKQGAKMIEDGLP